jgi:hypothetical protein
MISRNELSDYVMELTDGASEMQESMKYWKRAFDSGSICIDWDETDRESVENDYWTNVMAANKKFALVIRKSLLVMFAADGTGALNALHEMVREYELLHEIVSPYCP